MKSTVNPTLICAWDDVAVFRNQSPDTRVGAALTAGIAQTFEAAGVITGR